MCEGPIMSDEMSKLVEAVTNQAPPPFPASPPGDDSAPDLGRWESDGGSTPEEK